MQGDVIGLYNSSGNVVCRYVYDSWGNLSSVKDANGNDINDQTNIANVNPIRYRGYYYDKDTGFYYLQSRYYDPVVGRFLNADSQLNPGTGLTGMNLFAYCGNNPINNSDPAGHYWDSASGQLMMSPFSFYDSYHPPERNFMNPRGLAKLPYQVSSGSTNASSGSSGSSRNRGSSGSSKAQTVLSAVADVAIGTWANQKSIPKLQLQNYRIWTMEANTLASTCKTAGKVGGPVAMAFLAIDIVFDCMDYRGSNLKKAIGLDVFGFSAGVGSGWVIGAAAAACTNPYSAVVVGSVVILTVGSSLLINQVVSNAKNTYLT